MPAIDSDFDVVDIQTPPAKRQCLSCDHEGIWRYFDKVGNKMGRCSLCEPGKEAVIQISKAKSSAWKHLRLYHGYGAQSTPKKSLLPFFKKFRGRIMT